MIRLTAFVVLTTVCFAAYGDDAKTIEQETTQSKPNDRESRLAEYLNQCKFVGQFTVDGREMKGGKPEAYTISKCEKLPAKDMYRMTAKIVYGSTDAEVPLDLKILFAGNTPVITLDNLWIPGMGTFSSRVLIHNGRYTGTWQHGEKGGHMFGKIEQIEEKTTAE